MSDKMKTRRYTKASHRKTRTGCFKCRLRRVKCDEQKPVCGGCQRLNFPCQFPESSAAENVSSPGSGSNHDDRVSASGTRRGSSDVREHAAERSTSNICQAVPIIRMNTESIRAPVLTAEELKRMELYLLHAYMSHGIIGDGRGQASAWRTAWFVELPRLALKHKNLLYALLAFSALQLQATSDPDSQLRLAQQEFWSLALQEQQIVIASDFHHLEATTLAAYLICMIAFGMLKERSRYPYTAPLDWFEVAQGALRICPDEETLDENSSILGITFRLTATIRNGIFHDIDEVYSPILTYRLEEETLEYTNGVLNEMDTQAYKVALGVVTCFRHSVAEKDPAYLHQRWICSFGQIVPPNFISALRELRPRALVILACFWSVLGNTETVVLRAFGDAQGSIPRAEILAIKDNLPSEWQRLLQRPLDELLSLDG